MKGSEKVGITSGPIEWRVLLLRIALGIVYLYAGVLKLAEPQAFADSIYTFRLVPTVTINLMAASLPLFEIMLGGFLLLGIFVNHCAFSIQVLSAVFFVALLQGALRGLQVDCGCFGPAEAKAASVWISMGQNIVIFWCSRWIYFKTRGDQNRLSAVGSPGEF